MNRKIYSLLKSRSSVCKKFSLVLYKKANYDLCKAAKMLQKNSRRSWRVNSIRWMPHNCGRAWIQSQEQTKIGSDLGQRPISPGRVQCLLHPFCSQVRTAFMRVNSENSRPGWSPWTRSQVTDQFTDQVFTVLFDCSHQLSTVPINFMETPNISSLRGK